MKKDKDKKDKVERNRPAKKGRKNDPDVRDESAAQPGVQTMSDSKTDNANEHVTKTAADGFDADTNFGKKADKTFDED